MGTRSTDFVVGFEEIDRTWGDLVGGKGTGLGELWHLDGVDVPEGFCVTTHAFRRVMAESPSLDELIDRLSRLELEDRDAISAASATIRTAIEAIVVPDDIATAIIAALDDLGAESAYAVRSSATAEDLPNASFAGQQDSFLNVVGAAAIVENVSRCWASLFTERAVNYRMRNGFDHRTVSMAVVVQRMVQPMASGVMFTADPISGNRKVVAIEATHGLGEGLVSGRVNADSYEVRSGVVSTIRIAGEQPMLGDADVLRLAEAGRRIEVHLGSPQDIEWCLDGGGELAIVQSRPITTLFPPPVADDDGFHVYVSVGHQQMMTDPMRPLGFSMWQMNALPRMYEAAGRLFVDVADRLASPATSAGLVAMFTKADPLIGGAMQTILDRGDISPAPPDAAPAPPLRGAGGLDPVETDPAIVAALIARNEASVEVMQHEIRMKSGEALLEFIRTDILELKRLLFDPLSHQALMTGMDATWWLNEHIEEWLGEKNAADALTQSAPGNITSEMGLALMDVADVIRPHDAVVGLLERGVDDGFLAALPALSGGPASRDAIQAYLDRYGMRCVGEIDITRPRWSERPSTLVPVLLSNIKSFEPGEGQRRFEHGRQQSLAKEADVLRRLRELPDGDAKADETKQMIDRVRTFAGYREFPKYGIVRRTFIYKQALLSEAQRLVHDGVLRDAEDIFWLTFQELEEVVRTSHADDELIARRKDSFATYAALTPPRVITSDGEAVIGSYGRADFPVGALVGLPVSSGTIEGRARVILDISEAADIEPGDILVTPYTDPSWSPLFVLIAAMVTEVGGQMTHGAVIAREYGLPAVVGVEHATQLIRDGQRIRVNGTNGYVEILS